MFTKLLKHDFRSTWGLLGLLSLICLGAGTLGSVLVRGLNATEADSLVQALLVIGFMTIIFYLIAYSVASMFLLLGRFYKSRFTDEGYLTFTLPVTSHQVLLSGFTNCALGLLLSFFVTILSFGIMVFFGIEELDGERIAFIMCLQHLPKFLDMAGVGNILLFLLMLLAAMANELMTIMLAITIGAVIAKKHPLLTAIGAYYGIQIVVSVLGTMALNFVGNGILGVELTQENFVLVFGLITLGLTALAVTCYYLMYWLVQKKLNLN